jgi:DNA-binding response OmpR family regulator
MKKILIIEDDPKIVQALEIRFEASGYETVIAADAVMGANLARSATPDLIILDISLPGGNGLRLAEEFRMQPETRSTPIIFVTASKDPNLRQRAMELQAAGLLDKPYDPEELLETARFALGEIGNSSRQLTRSAAPRQRNEPQRQILIIEDDRKISMALALRLKSAGYNTAAAYDALAGVNAALKDPPDLVLLDISMPAGDGFTVAERIQKLIPNPPPIIFLTASKQPGFRQKANELGAAGYFEKPYDGNELLTAIQQALDEHSREPQHS